MTKTDLIVIGGGAAGLMAGCAAGEAGLRCLIAERKHKPGRKLLACGNGRCNLTTNVSAKRMIEIYGPPVGSFLESAIRAFDSAALQRWFAENGLRTAVRKGSKVYPHTDCAGDVLDCLLDRLRLHGVSLALSSPVEGVERMRGGFRVATRNFVVEAPHVLLATGGVSWPKTGSVGDGLDWAKNLGHRVEAPKPGLVCFEAPHRKSNEPSGKIFEGVIVEIFDGDERVGESRGTYEIRPGSIGGTAISDASRIVARRRIERPKLRIRHPDGRTETLGPLRPRPIKEAMVTVGGISLKEIDPQTMESKIAPCLFFAGEVMDVDGPTGGYNLQAAFATARLAVAAIAKRPRRTNARSQNQGKKR